MITILGIDPGYGTIGYGVVRFDNMKFTPVQYGAANVQPGDLVITLGCGDIYKAADRIIEILRDK